MSVRTYEIRPVADELPGRSRAIDHEHRTGSPSVTSSIRVSMTRSSPCRPSGRPFPLSRRTGLMQRPRRRARIADPPCQPRTRTTWRVGRRLNSGRERIALAVLLEVADRPSVGERRRPPDIPVQTLPRMREDDTPRIEGQGAAAEPLRRRRRLTRAHFAKPF